MTQYSLSFPSLMGKSIFDDFIKQNETFVNKSTTGFPVTDMYKDDDGNSIIEMALAGYNKDNISVETENNKITISSSGVDSTNGRKIARRSFKKTFVNYDNLLDLSKITAIFQDGLLRLTVPTKSHAAKKMITIE